MIQKVVGISFHPTSDERVQLGSMVEIVHDKENQYSSRAIAVKFGDLHLGHIGEKGNSKHEEIFNVLPLRGVVCTMSRLGAGEEFSSFKEGEITHLEVQFDMACDNEGKIESFNEGVFVKFLKKDHRYLYNGQELVSATRYIKRWVGDFDSERVSAICANKYGCSQQDVLDFWDRSGDIAASFGTAVHDALEHFEKFKWLGEIIQNQKELPFNKALPTHPKLRQIVEDFYKQDLQEGEVETEILVTNVQRGLCGLVDRLLITGDKKCRVQDYKVNIDAEEISSNNKYLGQMAVLPKNKLSKYALQMSFYARLLELSGWTVEGLDVFVYENEWRHFKLDVIKLDF